METIQTYINNVFQGLPQTDEILKLKEEMLAHMEDKYTELKNAGKSESETIGIVISEFGNLDEILDEIHIHKQADNNPSTDYEGESIDATLPVVTLTEGDNFVKACQTNAIRIGLGVMFIFIGVISMLIMDSINDNLSFSRNNEIIENYGVCILLTFIGIAVAIFIYSGMQMETYEYINHGAFRLDYGLQSIYEKQLTESTKKGLVFITLGVVLCILSPIPVIISDSIPYQWIETTSVCILLAFVAVAVFLFMNSNPKKEAFEKLLHHKHPVNTNTYYNSNKKQDKVISAVAAIVWPFATLIFFVLGFVFHLWYINWVIWPITGILFGIFCSVYKIITSDSNQSSQ